MARDAIAWSLDEPATAAAPAHRYLFPSRRDAGAMAASVGDMRFVALWLDRTLEERVGAIAARRPIRRLRLVEQEPGTATEMAAGVSALLSPHFEVTTTVGDPIELLSTLQSGELLLVAPRMWDRLPPPCRRTNG